MYWSATNECVYVCVCLTFTELLVRTGDLLCDMILCTGSKACLNNIYSQIDKIPTITEISYCGLNQFSNNFKSLIHSRAPVAYEQRSRSKYKIHSLHCTLQSGNHQPDVAREHLKCAKYWQYRICTRFWRQSVKKVWKASHLFHWNVWIKEIIKLMLSLSNTLFFTIFSYLTLF